MWLKLCRKSEIVRCVKGSSYSNTSDTFYIGHHYTRTKRTTQWNHFWGSIIIALGFHYFFPSHKVRVFWKGHQKVDKINAKTGGWFFFQFCGLSKCRKNSAKNFSGKGMTLIKMQTWEKPLQKWFSSHCVKSWSSVTIICQIDELSWLFTNRFRATRYMKVKRMGITEILRRIWLLSANKMNSSDFF